MRTAAARGAAGAGSAAVTAINLDERSEVTVADSAEISKDDYDEETLSHVQTRCVRKATSDASLKSVEEMQKSPPAKDLTKPRKLETLRRSILSFPTRKSRGKLALFFFLADALQMLDSVAVQLLTKL